MNVQWAAREPGGVELLGEWLPPEGVLRVDDGRAYYCRNGIYELPGNAGAARKVLAVAGAGTLVEILHDNAYVVEGGTGQEYRIVRHAVHMAGRWAARTGSVP